MTTTQLRHSLSYLLTPALTLFFTIGFTSWSPDVQAHKGHAGPMITFIKTKTALKEMLPSEAKIVKRKQPLKDDAIEWAKKNYGIELDDKKYSYYLATDKKSGAVLGAAYVTKINYRHGSLKLAVGINSDKQLTQAAILGISEKYVVDFDGNVGKGLIKSYAGLSLQALLAKVEELTSSDKATREFAAAVRDAVVLLAAFTR
ncbi:hypothetical protein MNBD_GAMMA16-1569 [hydrothermal vent metagenome]|uniref:Uncharacterized protein n=1 Tax=hydrothermal vent metagenome TaxID=652676 RepID=A0A3B0YV87_9ZZZZ